MSKYQDRNIISDTHGNKIQSESVSSYNRALTNLSGAGDVKYADSDFKITHGMINGLKLNNYNGGSQGSLSKTTAPPNKNLNNPKFFTGKLKDAYYNAVLNNNDIEKRKILAMPDKIVGMLKVFQDSNNELQQALDKPLGAPGSPNIGLMSKNVNFLKYLSEFSFNGDTNIDIDLDDNNELIIKTNGAEPIYIERLIEQQTNPNVNSDKIVPVLGDPRTLIWEPMDTVGPIPLIEQITTDLNLSAKQANDDPKYSLDDNYKIETQLAEYDHTNMLNNKNASESLWPQAQQMAVSAINTIDPDNIESATPLQQKLLSIFSEYNQGITSDINLVEDYMNNGGEKWGNYIGAEANYSQENAPLVKFQRDILAWSFNNGYHSQNVLPYVKAEQAVKQGETEAEVDAAYIDETENKEQAAESILDTKIDKL